MRTLLGFLAACGLCAAQESVYLGNIGGRVSDGTGAVVQGARVSLRQSETNWTASAATDSEGRFRFSYLRLGIYTVQVTQAGFAAPPQEVTLNAGAAYELEIELRLAATEQIDVVAEAPVLELARTQISGAIPRAEIGSLPLNGRSFLDAALLVPGVSPTNTGSNQLFAETSAVPGQGLSVGSQRNLSNNFIVDGLSSNDDAAGLSGSFYGLDALQEVQVVTSGGQAEFGRALGGYFTIVTRSGTNAFHGDLYGYFRSSDWNASNPLSHNVLPLTQSQYGASFGGPVRRDRTFFFGNFEQRILNQSGLVTISPQNVAIINARLDAVNYPGPRITTGLYSNPVHNWTAIGKIDHQFNGRDLFTVRYNVYDVNARNQRGVGALSAPTASSNLDNRDQTAALANIWTISPAMMNETRGQFTYSDLDAPPSDLIGPAVSISGVATFGRSSSSPTGRLNKMVEVVDNLSFTKGAHTLRAGVNFLYNDDRITFPRAARGSYSFSSLNNFLNGVYNNQGFTQVFGDPIAPQTNPNAGFYIQDEWKLHPRLIANWGVRYDLQFLKTIRTDKGNYSPRIGFAWTPLASRRMVVRGTFGIFYDRIPLRSLANALLSANNTTDPNQLQQVTVNLSPAQAGAPVFPNILDTAILPPGVLFNFTTMQRDMQNAYSQQASLQIEQQIGRSATLSVAYQHIRGLHLIAAINQNVPSCAAAGNNNGCRPNPNFANNSRYSSLADSYFDGMTVSFLQRPAKWASMRISYTFSKSLNNIGEFFFSGPLDPYNIWRDYGRSDDDQRHRVVADGTINARWFEISGMMQYYSALPLNITTGTTTVQGTAARPMLGGDFIGRNVGTGFDFFNVNARVSRIFRVGERLTIQPIAESFNLLNHVNGLTRNGVFGTGTFPTNPSPTFRQTTAVHDARSFQLALRIGF